MDMNSVPVAGYTQHSCAGGCVGGDVGGMGDIPSLQDIAGYSSMTPEQQQLQRQQLQQANETAFSGMPWRSSSGWTVNPSQALPNTQGVQAAALPNTQGVQAAALPNTQGVQAAQVTKGKKAMPALPVFPGVPAVAGAQTAAAFPDVQSVAGAQTAMGTQIAPGTTSTPLIPGQMAPITPTTRPVPMTGASLEFLNGFLRTQIGRAVKVSFLIGTNTFQDRNGILLGVGANYILLQEAETDDLLACDFYNIKFVTFYY
jgi:hypothetical protein